VRAARLRGRSLELVDVAEPTPGPGELLLRIRLAGICATDLHAPESGIPEGTILGHEFVATIVGAGEGVDRGCFPDGQTVVALPVRSCGRCASCLGGDPIHCRTASLVGTGLDTTGAFAELAVVSDHAALAVADGVSDELAVLTEPLAVALHVIRRAGVGALDRVLVVGGGPIGLAVTAWCRHTGVRDVVVSDPVAGRRQAALLCGAHDSVDPAGGSVIDAWRTLGRPSRPDVIIECVGNGPVVQGCLGALGRHGRLLIAGLHSEPASLELRGAFFKELSVGFSSWYDVDEFRYATEMVQAGRLDIGGLLTHIVDLDGLPDAYEALKHPSDQCKVAVDPRPAGTVNPTKEDTACN
jgi:2-desacetyl-2-hydroxyethyl bacteriochlorophyllide A dehydrogenase